MENKYYSNYQSLEESKFKSQDTTAHLLIRTFLLKFSTKVSTDAEQAALSLSCTVSGNIHGAATSGNGLGVYLKSEVYTYHMTHLFHSQVFIKEKWRHWSTQNLYTNVSNSFIHSFQKLGTFQVSPAGEGLNKLWDVHTMAYYSAIKKVNCWYMQLHAYISSALRCEEEARL